MGISISYEDLEKLGIDRMVNAAGAYAKYRKGAIIIDFGTATTFDYISSEGIYMGGAISPGILISANALFRHAYRLPKIERFYIPDKVLAKNTEDSINTGVILGYASLVDGMINKIKCGGICVVDGNPQKWDGGDYGPFNRRVSDSKEIMIKIALKAVIDGNN